MCVSISSYISEESPVERDENRGNHREYHEYYAHDDETPEKLPEYEKYDSPDTKHERERFMKWESNEEV